MSIKLKPIVVVGSINIDLVVTAPRIPVAGETIQGDGFQQHFGGKGANQAVAAARLGYPVEMIGMVGSDSIGAQARAALKDSGVNIEAVEIAESASGIASITVSRSGQNTIVIAPGANAQVLPAYLDQHAERIRQAGMVLAQMEIPMHSVIHLAEMCRRFGVPFILDPAPAQPMPADVLAGAAWFTPNETEAEFFARLIDPALSTSDPSRLAQAFLQSGARAVALKLGSRGVFLALSGGTPSLVPGFAVDALDTTAAGDAFNGAFATALMLGKEPKDAARFACAAAAVSVTRRGAQPSMPSREEVDNLLRMQT